MKQLVNNTHFLVFKCGSSHTGNENPIIACFEAIRLKIGNDDEKLYDSNYWRDEIEMFIGVDEHLKPTIIREKPCEFIEKFKMEMDTKISEILRYERMLPEDLFYAIMELEMSIKTDVSMMYMNQMSKALENSYCQPEMIHAMLVGWCNRALSMEKYYKESI